MCLHAAACKSSDTGFYLSRAPWTTRPPPTRPQRHCPRELAALSPLEPTQNFSFARLSLRPLALNSKRQANVSPANKNGLFNERMRGQDVGSCFLPERHAEKGPCRAAGLEYAVWISGGRRGSERWAAFLFNFQAIWSWTLCASSTTFFFLNWKCKTWTSVNSSGKSWGNLVNVTESALKIFLFKLILMTIHVFFFDVLG